MSVTNETVDAKTKAGLKAALHMLQAVAYAIQECGEQGIPSGHLYAGLAGKLSFDSYNRMIGLLEEGGLTQSNHLLKWVGPEPVKV